jgi:hypothetical protein
MKRILAVMTLLALTVTGPWTGSVSADPAIHEIVAAYCSGGDVGVIDSDGFLEPPPISTPGSPTFARPVLASGAVDPGTLTVTGKPSAKFEEGTSVFALSSATLDHPSAACPGSSVLP